MMMPPTSPAGPPPDQQDEDESQDQDDLFDSTPTPLTATTIRAANYKELQKLAKKYGKPANVSKSAIKASLMRLVMDEDLGEADAERNDPELHGGPVSPSLSDNSDDQHSPHSVQQRRQARLQQRQQQPNADSPAGRVVARRILQQETAGQQQETAGPQQRQTAMTDNEMCRLAHVMSDPEIALITSRIYDNETRTTLDSNLSPAWDEIANAFNDGENLYRHPNDGMQVDDDPVLLWTADLWTLHNFAINETGLLARVSRLRCAPQQEVLHTHAHQPPHTLSNNTKSAYLSGSLVATTLPPSATAVVVNASAPWVTEVTFVGVNGSVTLSPTEGIGGATTVADDGLKFSTVTTADFLSGLSRSGVSTRVSLATTGPTTPAASAIPAIIARVFSSRGRLPTNVVAENQ